MNLFRPSSALALLLPLTLLAACGDSDTTRPTTPPATAAPTTPLPTTPPSGTASPASAAPTAPASPGSTPVAPATAAPTSIAPDTFPVTIEHKYGTTTIDAKPERIVVVDFAEHEGLLAIGAEPVAVRDWYGDQPYATWPWAQDELGDLTPEVIPAEALNFEQIAALRPDVVLGISSGMTDADYATLSAIAPTIAQPGEYVDYGVPWDVALTIDARAIGRSAEAAQVIAETKALFAAVREEHPEWAGLTAGVTYLYESQPGGYSSQDPRARFLAELGLATPSVYDAVAGDQFWFTVSGEEVATLDADAIVWLGDGEAAIQAIRDLPLRNTLTAFAEGREILADSLLAGAFSHASPLSYPYVIEHLVPELELALDGDPATAVPSAAQIAPG